MDPPAEADGGVVGAVDVEALGLIEAFGVAVGAALEYDDGFASRHCFTDEDIHVAYLQTALAEINSVTLLTTTGLGVPGAQAVQAACASGLANQTGASATPPDAPASSG